MTHHEPIDREDELAEFDEHVQIVDGEPVATFDCPGCDWLIAVPCEWNGRHYEPDLPSTCPRCGYRG